MPRPVLVSISGALVALPPSVSRASSRVGRILSSPPAPGSTGARRDAARQGDVPGVSQDTGCPQARQSWCWAPHRAAPLVNKSTTSPRKKVRFQFMYSPVWETAALIPPLTAFVKKKKRKKKFFHLLICSFGVISFLINRIKYQRSSYSLFESFCFSRGSLALLGHREPAAVIFSPGKSS